MKRIPAGEIEKLALQQLMGLFQSPEIIRTTLIKVREKEDSLRHFLLEEKKLYEMNLIELKKLTSLGHPQEEAFQDTNAKIVNIERQLNILKTPTSESAIISALKDTAGIWEFLFPAAKYELLQLLIEKIVVSPDRFQMHLRMEGLEELALEMTESGFFNKAHTASEDEIPEVIHSLDADGHVVLDMALKMKMVDGHCNIIVPNEIKNPIQSTMLRAIHQGLEWAEMLETGKASSIADLSKITGLGRSYIARLLSLSNLSPMIIEAITLGHEPEGLSLKRLFEGFPDDWEEQREALGF